MDDKQREIDAILKEADWPDERTHIFSGNVQITPERGRLSLFARARQPVDRWRLCQWLKRQRH